MCVASSATGRRYRPFSEFILSTPRELSYRVATSSFNRATEGNTMQITLHFQPTSQAKNLGADPIEIIFQQR